MQLIFLQDTQFKAKLECQIWLEWSYEGYFASDSSQARKTVILMNNTFDFKGNKIIKNTFPLLFDHAFFYLFLNLWFIGHFVPAC